MTTLIDRDASLITLINVFEVSADRADALIDLLDRATIEVMRHQPGFVSANIHKSLDGTRVTNYAQWRTVEDFQRMLENPDAQVHMREAAAMVERYTPTLQRVVSVHA